MVSPSLQTRVSSLLSLGSPAAPALPVAVPRLGRTSLWSRTNRRWASWAGAIPAGLTARVARALANPFDSFFLVCVS